MTAPAAIHAAIAAVSPIVCDQRCGLARIVYNELHDRLEISHVLADCPYVTEPDSDAAMALALSVDKALARYVWLGEPTAVHVWAAGV